MPQSDNTGDQPHTSDVRSEVGQYSASNQAIKSDKGAKKNPNKRKSNKTNTNKVIGTSQETPEQSQRRNLTSDSNARVGEVDSTGAGVRQNEVRVAKQHTNGVESRGKGQFRNGKVKHLNADAPVFVAPALMTPGDMVGPVSSLNGGVDNTETPGRSPPVSTGSIAQGVRIRDAPINLRGAGDSTHATPDTLIPTNAKNSKNKRQKAPKKRNNDGGTKIVTGDITKTDGECNEGVNEGGGVIGENKSPAMTRAERMTRHNNKIQAAKMENNRSGTGNDSPAFTQRHNNTKGNNARGKGGGRGKGHGGGNHGNVSPMVNPANTQLATRLAQELSDQSYECTVCYDTVGRKAKVYSCETCYMVFHLTCISQWAKANAKNNSGSTPSDGSWRCPGCQTKNTHIPTRYTCFCGQTTNPDWNPYNTPHTCGRMCKKRLDKYSAIESKAMALARKGCRHTCSIECHPGPCPPCELYTNARCLCGATTRKVLCAELALLEGPEGEGVVCETPCKRLLNCSKHECEEGCHAQPCKPCARTEQQRCYCGKAERTAKCGDGLIDVARLDTPAYFACDPETECGRLLGCGKHRCARPCHPGDCYTSSIGLGKCPYSPENVTTCACGKEALTTVCARKKIPMRTSCEDPRPTCEAVCAKPLPCGELSKTPQKHLCKERCHTGPCKPCVTGTVRVTCRCGSETKTFACADACQKGVSVALRCKRMCQKKLHCKRHTCEVRCCPFAQRQKTRGYAGLVQDSVHECASLCGRMLGCGLHQCTRECHEGSCPPCIEASYDDLYCLCGKTMRRAPIPCNTPRPTCTFPCTRTHTCTHPVTHECHNETNCPPCVVLVDRECVGGHEVRGSIPCHMTDVSCGALCGKPLSCGHKCNRKCHGGRCEPEPADLTANATGTATHSVTASINSSQRVTTGINTRTAGCGQACGKVLSNCGHLCSAPCHVLAGTACPAKCTRLVDVFCACGMRADKMSCAKVKRGVDDTAALVSMAEHNSMLDGAISHTQLPCNDRCTTLQRSYKLAQALDINVSGSNADRVVGDRTSGNMSSNAGVVERRFEENLVRAYHAKPDFILSVEEFFAQTIKQYKEGKSSGSALMSLSGGVKSIQQLSASYTPIQRYQVEVFLLLGNHYGLYADLNENGKRMKMDVSCDARSFVPALLLSQAAMMIHNLPVDHEKLVGVVVRNLPLNAKLPPLNAWASVTSGLRTNVHKLDDRRAVITFLTYNDSPVELSVADKALNTLVRVAHAEKRTVGFKATWLKRDGSGPTKLTPDANGWVALTKSKAKVSKPVKAAPTVANRFDILEKTPEPLVAEVQEGEDIPDDWEEATSDTETGATEETSTATDADGDSNGV